MDNKIFNENDILETMMSDLANYDGPLGPGPYWQANQKNTLNWIKSHDLNTFRNYNFTSGKALNNFGGGSLWRKFSEVNADHEKVSNSFLFRVFQKLRFSLGIKYYQLKARKFSNELSLQQNLRWLFEQYSRSRDIDGDLKRIEASMIGDPSDAMVFDNNLYTPKFLFGFLKYLELKEYVDFSTISSFLDIGPGVGVLAEVLAKLNPALKIYLVDIPPQLYVTQKVMQATFPNEVASYESIKSDPSILKSKDHRIFILAPWQIDLIEADSIDLMFNSCFNEMHEDTVKAYLDYVTKWRVKNIYVRSLDEKKTSTSVVTDDYEKYLANHDLIKRTAINDESTVRPAEASGSSVTGRKASAIYFKYKT